MWPRTSWSLSSLTLNIVLGRASVTSPSISIFSSFAMRGEGTSPTLERRLARTLGEEGLHGPLQVLGRKQLGELVGGDLVGAIDPALAVGAHDPLGRRMRARWAAREARGEAHALLVHGPVRHHPVDDTPALERRRVVKAAGIDELAGAPGPGALGHALGATGA